ncbi:hypothetical protein WG926_22550 [Tistrella sp. BH-R2-4]|uniref:Uncharacterized protein n=1 Tax=Tistrella arctica TaxID=3133430 RepID=A0ABU9YQL7_9PROT
MASITVSTPADKAAPQTTLNDAARPEHQITEGLIRLGSLLAAIGRGAGGAALDIDRDRTPAEPIDLG